MKDFVIVSLVMYGALMTFVAVHRHKQIADLQDCIEELLSKRNDDSSRKQPLDYS